MKRVILFYALILWFHNNGASNLLQKNEPIPFISGEELNDKEPNYDRHLLFKPLAPRKLKSKARETLEIPNVFFEWYSYFFNPAAFLFTRDNELPDDCNHLFLRGPPCVRQKSR